MQFVHLSTGGPPVPRPDPNDPEAGHFCAPWCEGFCEANFCVLHSGNANANGGGNGNNSREDNAAGVLAASGTNER